MVLASGERKLRLSWSGEAKPVAVPAGAWTLMNYKIERTHQGAAWHLSGTSPCGKGPSLEVKEGADAKLAIDDRVQLSVAVKAHAGKTHLVFGVKGHDGMGLSVVKEDARPTPSWSVLKGDRKLDSGDFRYG